MKLARAFLPPALAVICGAIAVFAQPQPQPANTPPPGPGPGGPPGRGPGGPPPPEVKLRKQFDKDGDKILNATERKAAREHIAANPPARRGGGRGRGGAQQEPPK